jgi:hypothetical protein
MTTPIMERVARAIYATQGTGRSFESIRHTSMGNQLFAYAKAALEASRHAELTAVANSLLWVLEHHWDDPVADAVQKRKAIRMAKSVLSKIGGEPCQGQ